MTIRILSFLSLTTTLLIAATAQAGERFQVSIMGKPAGFMELNWSDDQSLQVHFEFNDRGRGPNIDSGLSFDKAGVLTSITNKGVDYFKGPVDESFRIEDGRATWSSKAEKSDVAITNSAYFSSAYGTPVETGLLARALLSAEDRAMDLLPGGRASIAFVGEKTIGDAADSQSINLYQISGMDFEPASVWLNPDGSFFAVVSGWTTVLPEGYEDLREELLAAQREADGKHQAKMARGLGYPVGTVAWKSVRVFQAESGEILENQTVVIKGDRIDAVGRAGSIEIPEDAHVFRATDKLLMPGLWDMHTHLSAIDGPLNIAAGVTMARDLANDMDLLLDLEERFNTRKAIGPRVVRAGFMDGSGPFAGPTKALVDTEEDVLKWLNTYDDSGYVQIKIYSSINAELVPFIVAETRKRGMRMSGHIPANMWAEDAVRAGYDEIQHINMFFLNFYKDVTDTRTPARFIEVARRGGELDLESEEVRAFVQLLKDEGIVYDPTVAVFQHILTARPGEPSPGTVSFIHRLPPQVQRQYTQGGFPPPDGQWELADAAFEKMLDVIKHLHDQGIPLVAGTDGLAGFTLHHEMALYARAGIPNADVLRIATLESAKIMGMDAELGSIAPGKLADVILIDGNPVKDMADLSKVELVIKDGVVYKSKAVYAALGVH